jgi:hypothetical protein
VLEACVEVFGLQSFFLGRGLLTSENLIRLIRVDRAMRTERHSTLVS